MGSFPVLQWLIVVLIIGLLVSLMIWTARRKHGPDGPIGFGGWLLLLAIGQTMAPVRTLVELTRSAALYERFSVLPNGRLVAYGEASVMLAFTALEVCVTISMFRKSSLFQKLFFYQWVALIGYQVVDVLLVSAALGIPVTRILARGSLGQAVAGFVVTGLWVWYVHKSVRVRNTFNQHAGLAEAFA